MLPAVAFVTARSVSVVGGSGGGGGVVPLLPPPPPPPQPQARLQSSAHSSPRRLDCALGISRLCPRTPSESSESRVIGSVVYMRPFQAIRWSAPPLSFENQPLNNVREPRFPSYSQENHPSSQRRACGADSRSVPRFDLSGSGQARCRCKSLIVCAFDQLRFAPSKRGAAYANLLRRSRQQNLLDIRHP